MDLNFAPYISILPYFLLAFVTGLLITPVIRNFGLKHKFSTKPKSEWRSDERNAVTVLHEGKAISRLGEFAMLIPLFVFMWFGVNLTTQVFGLIMAFSLVAVVGALDSKYNLSEFIKLFTLIFASVLVVFTGTFINIHAILDLRNFDAFLFNPLTSSNLSIISILFTLFWLVTVPTALSYVGGVDGLSEGTSAVAILIFLLIGVRTGDVLTMTLASLSLGGLLGLLPYNFYPKSIMSEHLIYGYLVAVLAILSQAKITTSILILTIPLIDFIFIAFNRMRKYFRENKGKSFKFRMLLHYLGTGDRNHLHHKLLDLGFTHAQISLMQYFAYALLGFIALAVSGLYLTIAILGSVVIVVLIFYYINRKLKKSARTQ